MNILVTGAAGFIGSNFVRWIYEREGTAFGSHNVTVLDALTYAGNVENLAGLERFPGFRFVRGDIRDRTLVEQIVAEQTIDAIVNFAAESHVDRSILDPLTFVRTNVEGTQVLLEVVRTKQIQRYLQISTDEVYGSLGPTGRFTEQTPLDPSSAYSASKAASDLLALAAHRTHHLPVLVTRCSNNYGPYQFPEKLIPLMITNAMNDLPLPVYGDGKNVRSWLHVDDHSRAIMLVLQRGRPGEVYNIGGSPESERENIDVVERILGQLNKPRTLMKWVEDRKGHDRRYAVDYSKIHSELGWEPKVQFERGLEQTVQWYLKNVEWWQSVKSGAYLKFYEDYYGERLKHSSAVG